ncbi:MAG TPA: ABC transporter substrate-binding protein, partial [Devosia sp.]|nr:ABC transporter substrate-binding protein [Devosia sp.]
MKINKLLVGLLTSVTLVAGAAQAAELTIVLGDTGTGLTFLQSQLDRFEAQSEHTVTIVPMPSSTTDQFAQYRLWLAAGNSDVDVYTTDVIWAPQLADHFVDLTEATKDIIGDYFPAIVESQTVDGKLVALPSFTDAPALYYRQDLLDKYGKTVPTTWTELETTAKEIMDGERAAGNPDMWGFVFQGNSYEGLTCNALEWVMSNGGGQIIEADGTISINNPKAAAILDQAASWVGTIAPKGVLAYTEEESRGVWQLGNAVFMRNWPYAYQLGNSADSAIAGKFGATKLPMGDAEGARSAATLGGWNLGVSN